MKGPVKFLILAVAGFGLGAGAAWLQQPHLTPPAFPPMKTSTASDASPITEVPKAETKAETPATSTTTADDGVAAPTKEAAEKPETETPAPKTDELTAPEEKVKSDKEADIQPAPSAAKGEVDASPEVAKNLAAARGEAPVNKGDVGGAFSLTDHDGKPVTDKSWPGKYLLVFFGFTNCPDVCPVTLDKLTSALDQLGDDVAKVQPLFITVDSFRDKPAVLKDYVGHFHKSIIGLTGSDDELKKVQDEYKVYSSRHNQANGHDYSFDHSAFVYFMSPDGKLAEIIGTDEKASDIAAKMQPWLDGKKQAETQPPAP